MADQHLQHQLGIDDLIDALGARLRWQGAHADLSTYWSRRYGLLCDALQLDPDPFNDVGDERCDPGVLWVLRHAAVGLWEPPNPFSGFIEGTDAVVELRRTFAPDIGDLGELHARTFRSIARACLLTLDPTLHRRTCPASILTDGGISPTPPDSDDYW